MAKGHIVAVVVIPFDEANYLNGFTTGDYVVHVEKALQGRGLSRHKEVLGEVFMGEPEIVSVSAVPEEVQV